MVGSPADCTRLESLLNDKRPAVAIAAIGALPRVADARLLGYVLDRIVLLPEVVRLFLQGTLREMRALIEPALVERLSTDASPRALARWTELAGALELPAALDRVALLAEHPDARVREAVARALRRVPRQRSVDILQRLLCDGDIAVRAAAAHALGELASPTAIPALLAAAHDVSWVGGTLRVANGCGVSMGRVVDPRVAMSWLTGCQVVEYLRAFLFGRLEMPFIPDPVA